MLVLSFVLGLLAFGGVNCDEHGANAVTFTSDTFEDSVPLKPHFVMFFAPW